MLSQHLSCVPLPADRTLVAAALTGVSLTLFPSAMSHGGVSSLPRWA